MSYRPRFRLIHYSKLTDAQRSEVLKVYHFLHNPAEWVFAFDWDGNLQRYQHPRPTLPRPAKDDLISYGEHRPV